MKLSLFMAVLCVSASALLAAVPGKGIVEGTSKRPIAVAHRGMWDDKVPQNTVEAIRRAYESGAVSVETDFHYTIHGQMVCMHAEKELAYYTGCRKKIASLTPEEVKSFNLGEKHRLDYRPVAAF